MNNISKFLIWFPAAIIVGFIVWYFSDIVIYILISAVLAIMGKPLMDRLSKIKIGKILIPRAASATITLSFILFVFAGLFLFLTPLVNKIVLYITSLDINAMGISLSGPLSDINTSLQKTFLISDPEFRIENVILKEIQEIFTAPQIASFFASVTGFIINLGIAIFVISFITFFFLKEQNMFNNMVKALFPDKYEQNVTHALDSVSTLLGRYFIGICIEILCITVLNGLGLHLIAGVDFSLAFVLAFISGVLNVIPYIGPWIGGIFGILLSLIGYDQSNPHIFGFILTVSAIFFITHMIDIFIFQPYIYSNSVKAHPLEIFLVILIAGSIGGVIGMLVAIPSYTVLRVFAREFFSNFKLVQKLTDNI
jgi:Predicted permease